MLSSELDVSQLSASFKEDITDAASWWQYRAKLYIKRMQSNIIIKMNLFTHNFQITLKEKNQWKAYTVQWSAKHWPSKHWPFF